MLYNYEQQLPSSGTACILHTAHLHAVPYILIHVVKNEHQNKIGSQIGWLSRTIDRPIQPSVCDRRTNKHQQSRIYSLIRCKNESLVVSALPASMEEQGIKHHVFFKSELSSSELSSSRGGSCMHAFMHAINTNRGSISSRTTAPRYSKYVTKRIIARGESESQISHRKASVDD